MAWYGLVSGLIPCGVYKAVGDGVELEAAAERWPARCEDNGCETYMILQPLLSPNYLETSSDGDTHRHITGGGEQELRPTTRRIS